MELLLWLIPTCAALWFLEDFGNGFLLNSVIVNLQIFSTDILLRFRALTQHFTRSKSNISSIPRLSIHTSAAPTTPSLDPTHSSGIQQKSTHSTVYGTVPGISPTTTPHTQQASTHPTVQSLESQQQYYSIEYEHLPTTTVQQEFRIPLIQPRTQPNTFYGQQQSKHPPPIISMTDLVSYPTSSSTHISRFFSPQLFPTQDKNIHQNRYSRSDPRHPHFPNDR